ncbi:Ig-like domain-containing protein, partial [Hydrogenophaga sp. 5NK40-0174]|uniref:Ig-like domain-containing protein n=1 Tax=Hydrogenophaga sp. 5NK40-0174 TaxID=3127649 RepID=UPI00333E61CD
APVATDNTRLTPEGVAVSGNVITNNTGNGVDSDPEGDTLTVDGFVVAGVAGTPVMGTPFNMPGVGDIVINGDGSYTFTPEAGFSGDVPVITYTLSDGTDTDTADLRITVIGGTDTPSIVGDNETTNEDTPVEIDVLANDAPGSDGPLTITEINGQPVAPGTPVALQDPVTGTPIGTVEILDGGTPGDPTDDTLLFTPAPGYNGPVDFTYTAEDQVGTALEAPVHVDVLPQNDPPVATDDVTNTPVGTPVTIDVMGNDSDPDGDPLTITEVNGTPITPGTPVVIPGEGIVALDNGGTPDDPSDDRLVFLPDPGFMGPATFDYTVADPDGETSTATVTVNVGEDNLPPVANPDTNSVGEDDTLTVDAANGVIQSPAGQDVDPNGDTLSVAEVNGDPALVGEPVTGTNGTLTLNPDGSYVYQPNPATQALGAGESVSETFTYTVTDPSGETATTTLTIVVNGANDAPVAVDDSEVTPPDTPVSGNVLGNDSDPDGDTLTVTEFTVGGTTYPAGTTVTLPSVGELIVNPDGSYTFTPEPGFEGSVPPVTYTVTDGADTATADLTLLVDGVDDPPIAVNDTVVGQEDEPVTFDPRTNDIDPEGEPLSITEINGQPISVGSPITIYDPADGVTPIGEMSLEPDGRLTFDPVPDYFNTTPVPVQYTVVDPQGNPATATINITINPVNDPPVAVDDGPVPTVPDEPVSGNVIDNDSDPEGDPLQVVDFTIAGLPGPIAAGTLTVIPGVGTLVINPDGGFTFDPDAGYLGPVPPVTYTLSDGALTSTATLSFEDVAQPPTSLPPAPSPAPAPTPAPAPAPVAVVPPAPAPEDIRQPGWGDESETPNLPVQYIPYPATNSLHVLYAVGNSQTEAAIRGSITGGIQAGAPLMGEAMAMRPDGLLFRSPDELSMQPSLFVQHAVRHEPLDMSHTLHVQLAVRSSQVEAEVRDAAINSLNSANPVFDSLLDPFALGAAAPEGSESAVAEAAPERPEAARSVVAAESSDSLKAEQIETNVEGQAQVTDHTTEIAVDKPKAAVGFRAQLSRMASDWGASTRPVTRTAVKS